VKRVEKQGALRLFALGASQPLGKGVSAALGVELAEHVERNFEDGEHKMRPSADVRGCDVYVLHSLYGDDEQSGHDKLCRMLFFCAALKDAGAAQVTAITPYLCYGRKDRRTRPFDPVMTRYVAQLFEAVGVDRVVAMDHHNPAAFENAFRLKTVHLEALPLFVAHLTRLLDDRRLVVLSPDFGGGKRAEQLRQALEQASGKPVGIGFLEKHRSGGELQAGDLFAGDVKDRTVIVVDDLISTGGTLSRAARVCRERGAAGVVVGATHGLFVGGARGLFDDPALVGVLATNTVPPFRVPADRREKLTVLDAAPLLADAVQRMHEGF
jgi:ribose-phosphate pyrophosphokinase